MGREIVFTSAVGGQLGLYRQLVGVSEPAESLQVVKGAGTLAAAGWTHDGKAIVYSQAGPDPWSIWTLPLTGGRRPTRLLSGSSPRLSPDGQWVAYVSGETGTLETYVQRFPELGSKHRISEGGGVHPRWTSDGRELVYWASPGGLRIVNIINGAAVGNTLSIVQAPVLGLIDGRTHYDASPDGKRFLVRQPAGPARACDHRRPQLDRAAEMTSEVILGRRTKMTSEVLKVLRRIHDRVDDGRAIHPQRFVHRGIELIHRLDPPRPRAETC